MLYTSCSGQRRLRICNMSLNGENFLTYLITFSPELRHDNFQVICFVVSNVINDAQCATIWGSCTAIATWTLLLTSSPNRFNFSMVKFVTKIKFKWNHNSSRILQNVSKLTETNPKAMREELMQQCATILACYRCKKCHISMP